MLLYKYRPWADLAKVADILVHQRLWCAEYSSLNDPFEGQFLVYRPVSIGEDTRIISEIDTPIGMDFYDLMPPQEMHLNEILGKNPPRVCSLSESATSINMWSLYADSHAGVAIQIDTEGLNAQPISYVKNLPEIEGDPDDGGSPNQCMPLLMKTEHWKYECEYRILTPERFISIEGRIKSVIIGCRFRQEDLPILRRLSGNIPIAAARLNHQGALIDLDSL